LAASIIPLGLLVIGSFSGIGPVGFISCNTLYTSVRIDSYVLEH
jgi:hypothetical protein